LQRLNYRALRSKSKKQKQQLRFRGFRTTQPNPAQLLIWLLILILILILIFATSGGRAEGMRREVTGMDARQALRPQGRGLQRVLPGACP
ncbi:hypothetical protein, partial [Pseudomonas juntendi]|uniref:hypothetical protein n=1 Tax=Pseudomonas juntendi TaxID=2666183 RepID=UPI003B4310FC